MSVQSKTFFVAVLSMTITAAGFAAAQDLESKLKSLESRWENAMDELDLPGFAVAVTNKDGIVYAKGFGLRSIEPEKPFTPSTASYIASVTKVYVTLAVMQLAEAGRVDLDTPVKTYLPRFQLSDESLTETLTVRDLLCHRYGVNSPPIVFADAYTGQITEDLYYRELPKETIQGEWMYSNLHFTLLGRVIEAVSGQSWKDYLDEQVFTPAGMHHTTAYASKLYDFEDSSQPLIRANGTWVPSKIRKSDSTMHAAGGLGSTVEDMARWIQVHLNGGAVSDVRLIKEDTLKQILTVHVEPKTNFFKFGRPEMGLGWYIGRYNRQVLVHHFGSYVGAHAHCSFMPEHNIGVAVVANSNTASTMMVHQVAADVYDAVLGQDDSDSWPHLVQRTQREIADADAVSRENAIQPGPISLSLPVEQYAGRYTNDTWGTLTIEVRDGALAGAPAATMSRRALPTGSTSERDGA